MDNKRAVSFEAIVSIAVLERWLCLVSNCQVEDGSGKSSGSRGFLLISKGGARLAVVCLGRNIMSARYLLHRYHILFNRTLIGNLGLSRLRAIVPESLWLWVEALHIGVSMKQQGGGVAFARIRLAESGVFGLSVGCQGSSAVSGGSASSRVSRAWQ
jgi:hypothetical protein